MEVAAHAMVALRSAVSFAVERSILPVGVLRAAGGGRQIR